MRNACISGGEDLSREADELSNEREDLSREGEDLSRNRGFIETNGILSEIKLLTRSFFFW